ncbi:STAS domain-containing protein [Streptomyces microflavus]|uniref:STAS domain-containing protein n=1 Tax=Streptomyces microflavus TaxID=1919 RepID=A0A7H8N0X9_STRMI|nr:STAS domain-containing protein [Streptomyces microflavus]QKW48011.1 STAS domain-containing protein [Streptomyces microflavus]WSR89048.1 STAS domain-containing protein [Streptomyces microflavus]
MTTHPHHLQLTTVDTQDSVRIEAHGNLDHDSAGLLLNEVTAQLAARPAMTDLHLHFTDLGTVDSMGLSTLLMIGRRANAAGVQLHLDDRPTRLDRLLRLTGTLDHLTAPPR